MPNSLRALAAVLVLCVHGVASAQVSARNLTLFAHLDEYHNPPGTAYAYSACWSYIHGDGREYAILGVASGTAIYNVTNPASTYRVGFIPGPTSIWREMKSYRNWIYVVTEGTGAAEGVQVIRMTDPEHPVLAATYSATFATSHTVAVDTTRALLVCNGTRTNAGAAGYPPGGLRVLSLASPEAPVQLARWPAGAAPVPQAQYVHDSVPIGNRLYCASIYVGTERVLDFTNPATPTEIASWTYPGAALTHNSWPDASGHWLYVTDEQNGQTLRVFDITNLASPQLASGITSNPQAIIHNAHVLGNELYLSNYTEGVRVLDLTDPAHPAEFAWADSYPDVSGGYGGVWEVCPFFPSGTVIASDMQTGLYVYRVDRSYGRLRVAVVDDAQQPITGKSVHLVTQGDSLLTAADGVVVFAPSPGSHTVLAHAFGYYDASATRSVGIGTSDTVTLALEPRPAASFAGTVEDAATSAPLEDASITLLYTPLHEHTDGAGAFAFGAVPADLYRVEVRRAGYVGASGDLAVGPAGVVAGFRLAPVATWDRCEFPSGWGIGAPGDDASAGAWVRVKPRGTGPPPPPEGAAPAPSHRGPSPLRSPGPFGVLHEEEGAILGPGNAQPYADHSPAAADSMCFVTGQGTDSTDVNQADVDAGRTTLTSPALDVSGMTQPAIGYWRWFYSWSGSTGQPDPNDLLAVSISNDNGATWVPVDTTRGAHNTWEERQVVVSSYVVPTSQVRLRFVAADLGAGSTVEAALDDLTTYDAAVTTAGAGLGGPPAVLRFRAPAPNPSAGPVRLSLELPAADEVVVEMLDVAGRRVRVLHRGPAGAGILALAWDGRDGAGNVAAAGLYFARARTRTGEATARLVRTR